LDGMVASRARATLGVVCVGVAVAIALVHNMQVEERRRLHKGVVRDKAMLAERERQRGAASTSTKAA